MDYGNISIKDLVADAIAFAENVLPRLGYTEVSFNQVYSYDGEEIEAMFNVYDDFQSRVSYSHQCQNGQIILTFPLSISGLKNREQRELAVMLKQQGESTQLFDLMVSAAGRKFVEDLVATRAKYAQLVDMRDA